MKICIVCGTPNFEYSYDSSGNIVCECCEKPLRSNPACTPMLGSPEYGMPYGTYRIHPLTQNDER